MEILEDNIIQNKLNSLDTLPEGYTPNLESKWSMLEAGLEGNNKKIVAWKPIAAAAMLFLLGGTMLLLHYIKPHGNLTSETTKPVESANIIITEAPTLGPTKITPPTVAVVKPAYAGSATKLASDHTKMNELEVTAHDTQQPVPNMEQAQEIQPLITASSKVKKQQFVEIDFYDPPIVNPQNNEPSLAIKSFKFGIGQNTFTKNEGLHENVFRLQRSF